MREMLHHSDVKGIELKKPSGSLYNFPMPDCMCQQINAGLLQMSDTVTLI